MEYDIKKSQFNRFCPICGTSNLIIINKENSIEPIGCACGTIEILNLNVFVDNLILHRNPEKAQSDNNIWELNKNLHILRRVSETGKPISQFLNEPDLYLEVHKLVGNQSFKKIYQDHESGIKDMSLYLPENKSN